MLEWLFTRGASDREVDRMKHRIPPELWTQTLASHRFVARLDAADRARLHDRVAWFLASKTFTGVQGLVLDDAIRLSIALQACLPILHLSPALYAGWSEIVVYPAGFLIPRSDTDEFGLVHDYVQEAAGEAWEGGPVLLSWQDAAPGETERPDGFNVVIHEFAHKLDLAGGDADGMPDLRSHPEIPPRVWQRVREQAFAQLDRQLDRIEAAIPPDVDPESEAADAWYAELPLDPYALTDAAEFFAVSSETFFTHPAPLRRQMPDWYALLARYYRQDPLGDPSAPDLRPLP